MAKKEQTASITTFDAREIIRKGEIESELERERAVWTERSLRLLLENHPELEELRKAVRNLIIQYETKHWSDFDSIPKEQFKESDRAEKQVKKEFDFITKRKSQILAKLRKYGLNQNDLSEILAHRKSYVSELLNGVRAFSINDLIIIHRLFDIPLDNLVFAEISPEVQIRFEAVLKKADSKIPENAAADRAAALMNSIPGKKKRIRTSSGVFQHSNN